MGKRSLQADIQPYVRALWKLHDESGNTTLQQIIRDLEWQAVTVDRMLEGRMQKKRSGRYSDAQQIEHILLVSELYETVEELKRDGTDEGSHTLTDIFEQARGELGERSADAVRRKYYRLKKELAAADRKLRAQGFGIIEAFDPIQRLLAAKRLYPRSLRRRRKRPSATKPADKKR